MSPITPPSVAPTSIKPRTRVGFWAGLSLGICLGFGVGIIVSAKACPPVPVPASHPVAEIPQPVAPAPVPATAPPVVVTDGKAIDAAPAPVQGSVSL
jgi:hypothetical protein